MGGAQVIVVGGAQVEVAQVVAVGGAQVQELVLGVRWLRCQVILQEVQRSCRCSSCSCSGSSWLRSIKRSVRSCLSTRSSRLRSGSSGGS